MGKGSGVEVKARYKVAELMNVSTEKNFPEYYSQLKEMNLKEEEVVEKDPNARAEKVTKDMEDKKQVKEMMTSHFLRNKMSVALIIFKLITKRKYQIRATCSYFHCPIIGDVSHLGISVWFFFLYFR